MSIHENIIKSEEYKYLENNARNVMIISWDTQTRNQLSQRHRRWLRVIYGNGVKWKINQFDFYEWVPAFLGSLSKNSGSDENKNFYSLIYWCEYKLNFRQC